LRVLVRDGGRILRHQLTKIAVALISVGLPRQRSLLERVEAARDGWLPRNEDGGG
jgi:hypothetical protein